MARMWSAAVTTDVPVVTVAETAVISTPPISTSLDGDAVVISGSLQVLTGTATTAITIRVRRGVGVAGAVVGDPIAHTIGAAVNADLPFTVVDTPGAVAGQAYTVTYQATAASANATIGSSAVQVTVGSP